MKKKETQTIEFKQSWPQSVENKILSLLFFEDMSRKQLSDKLKIVLKANSLRAAITKLIGAHLIEYTFPDKPNSRFQKYRLTKAGHDLLLHQCAG